MGSSIEEARRMMPTPKVIAAAGAAMALAACSTAQVQGAQQRISDIQTALQVAEAIGNVYASLPVCAPGGPALCSDPAVVAKLKQADKDAGIAIAAAANVAATASSNDDDVTKAIKAAEEALAAYQDISKAAKGNDAAPPT